MPGGVEDAPQQRAPVSVDPTGPASGEVFEHRLVTNDEPCGEQRSGAGQVALGKGDRLVG
jgi:hypothetical protein